MKRVYLLLTIIVCLLLTGCSNANLVGNTYTYESSSVYYTDLRGNIVNQTADNIADFEKQRQEGNIKTNYYKLKYSYKFISKTVVKYVYTKDGNNIKNFNCEYNFEDEFTLKLKCQNNIKILKYDKKNNIITDANENEYILEVEE